MVVLDGNLYSIGGIRDDSDETDHYERATDDLFVYDIAGDSWSSGATLPKALWGQAAVAAGGSIYTFGGAETDVYGSGDDVDTIYKFTPGSGWSTLTPTCPEPVFATRGVLGADGYAYIVGGATGAENEADTDRIWRFDPDSESVDNATWATLDAPRRWLSLAAATVGETDYLYAFGGHSVSSDELSAAVYRYPLSGDNEGQREKMADAPTAFRQAISRCVIDGSVYIAYGHHSNADFGTEAGFKRDVYRYDLQNDSWDDSPPPLAEDHGRVPGAHGVEGGELYVAGGHIKDYGGDGAHVTRDYVNVFTTGGS